MPMSMWMRKLMLANLWRRRDRREPDLVRELQDHLDRSAADYRALGLTDVEARRRAAIELGGFVQVQEAVRETWIIAWLHALLRDVRHGARALRKQPGFTCVAVVSLALGIGATTAIFSIFNQVLLRPLAVPHPDALVNLVAPGPKPGDQSTGLPGSVDALFSYPMFRDLEQRQQVFTGIAAHRDFPANVSYGRDTSSGTGLLVSGSYFPVLGLEPALGRLLGPADDRTIDESPVVVISHALWQRRFGAHPRVLGDTLVVNGRRLTIVGVSPRGFDGTTLGIRPEVYVPITLRGSMKPGWNAFHNRRAYWAYVFARLQPGVSLDRARTQIDVVYRGLVQAVEAGLQEGMSDRTLARFKAKRLHLEPGVHGQSIVHSNARTPLILLLAVTGVVLLIACANIANLLLARAATRTSEIALRLSIGASRAHVVAQLVTESCLLAILGGLAALVVATLMLRGIVSLFPENIIAVMPDLTLDSSVLLFAAALTLGTGLLFGLFPAIQCTRPDLVSTMKGTFGQPAGGRGAARFRTALATTQIALSMMLLVAAGLFVKSLMNVSRVDLGLATERLVTFRISPELNGYTSARAHVLFERLEDELAAQPGVTGVTASRVAVLAGRGSNRAVRVEGFQAGPDDDVFANYNDVAPGYFGTMGIRLLAGRDFTRADALGASKVAVVNEAFARKFGLGRDVVGKRMAMAGDDDGLEREIVGLVQDAKYRTVKEAQAAVFFRPYRQAEGLGALTFYVRTSFDPVRMMGTVPAIVARLDPTLPVEQVTTLEQQVRDSVTLDRLIGLLSTAFAVLATLLAAVGLYGVLAYTVAQRTREIGVRMALGAAPGRVRGMMLGRVAAMTAVGGLVGLAGALAIRGAARTLLFEIEGHDPMVLASAGVVLVVVALAAGWMPAHRASRVDPLRALRCE